MDDPTVLSLKTHLRYSILSLMHDEGYTPSDAINDSYDKILAPLLSESKAIVEVLGSYVAASAEAGERGKPPTPYQEELMGRAVRLSERLASI